MRISRNFRYLAAALLVGLAIASGDEVPASAQGKTITLSMLAGYKENVLPPTLPDFEKKRGIRSSVDPPPSGNLTRNNPRRPPPAPARTTAAFVDDPGLP